MDLFPGNDWVPEEVFVFRMNRNTAQMWRSLEAHPFLNKCTHGIYAHGHQVEPIFEHMRLHGVVMQYGDQCIYLKDLRPWHIVVTETYLPHVMCQLEKVSSNDRKRRNTGTFTVFCPELPEGV